MSFILDALKKSESTRQRQAGPALFEVKVIPPRRVWPVWALLVGALLVIYTAVLAWLMLRGPAAAPTAPAAATRALRSAGAPAGAVRANRPSPASNTPRSPAAAPLTVSAAPASSPAAGPARAATAGRPHPQASPAAPSAPSNPADFTPASQPPGPDASAQGTLPLYAQIATQPGSDLPPLHLDLHVYDPVPSKRYVMINMHVLRAGDSLPDGVTVVAIRPDGVALRYRGKEFLLPR